MSNYYGDYQDDYSQGQIVDIQNQVNEIAAQSVSTGTLPAGASGQVYVVGVDGNPTPGNVTGDSNGAGLTVVSGVLTATLTQDLRTTASPTFKEVTLTDTAAVAALGLTAGGAYVQADFQAVIDKIDALLVQLRAGKIIPT